MPPRIPGGLVDLSIGTPVDPTPDVAREALIAAADAPGYPTVFGPESLRQAAVDWIERRFEVRGLSASQVLPTVGSKELIANLPTQLGLGAGDLVVVPELAYPTYEVGARYAGCEVVATDSTLSLGPRVPAIIYLNSPANPTGRILPPDHLRKVVDWARERGTLVVSDECYLEFAWEGEPSSVLHPDICGGSFDGILAVHSLSKRSNLAGYRDAFVTGDQALITELLEVRKHLGLHGAHAHPGGDGRSPRRRRRTSTRSARRTPPGATTCAGHSSPPGSRSSTPRARSTSG